MKRKQVAVIGAGMVGACVARYLQRDGHDVVMIDPLDPGEGASFGNAGCFNPSSLVPIAGPDTLAGPEISDGPARAAVDPLVLSAAACPMADPLRAGRHAGENQASGDGP